MTPGVKVKASEDDALLAPPHASRYRQFVARANFLSIDRPDRHFNVKELARDMATPKQSSWTALTRLGKYLLGRPRMTINFWYQQWTTSLGTCVDADWAGEESTRKSTSGGAVQLGDHLLRSWSSTQSVIALSSGENEFYALAKGCSQSMGIRSMLADMRFHVQIRLLADATTGKSLVSRRGLGRVRHIDVADLWIQSHVKSGDFDVIKMKNTYNSADMMTKHLCIEDMEKCVHQIGCTYAAGRAGLAPKLDVGAPEEQKTMNIENEI